ncbi:MAG: GNAT family N-acetyltransferase [Deltaproteobacteria bacterium]|nr:GNAT family N-acetyltransferase [Deltaproteobacteria bacterium]
MKLGDRIVLRRWAPTDADALAHLANNRNIWLNLKNRFPHPYARTDAEAWIAHCQAETGSPTQFAIDLDGAAIGGIGVEQMNDVHRMTAEVGYWVGEPHWGNGIASAAVIEMTRHAFAEFPLVRLQAMVFEWNPASRRVLEKAGYMLEARMARCIIKDGRLGDAFLYARLRD